ncbi:hypothetical protein [Kineococcus indalonis]|uniref:hypothetical protein n=1 Tax=Kineococcus indalonis TaxID=2696566 RepID=UPI001412900D|nr:hypothetical protein [Kineococcus indalonis]NAZ87583.1 hypothetical protein [Kineococcus indalonis]
MTRQPAVQNGGTPAARTEPGELATSAAPADVGAARALLALMVDTADQLGERLVATCALAHLDDVFPPYPPAPPATSDLRGQQLRDEAVDALLGIVATTEDVEQRARTLMALHEFAMPVVELLDAAEQR